MVEVSPHRASVRQDVVPMNAKSALFARSSVVPPLTMAPSEARVFPVESQSNEVRPLALVRMITRCALAQGESDQPVQLDLMELLEALDRAIEALDRDVVRGNP